MKLYVGITDGDWFRFLRARNADEMNFWRPHGGNNFGAINPGELFLFKSRYPENRIVGGAYFVRHTTLPLDLAWEVFKEANGVESLDAFRRKISSIRGDNERNPIIGCTVLTQLFYLRDGEYLPARPIGVEASSWEKVTMPAMVKVPSFGRMLDWRRPGIV